jgi:hypothetical protein
VAKKRKKTKSLLPKRVAGVKIPKSIRKGRAGRFITSPVGMALLSQALAAAGAATAVRKADPDTTVGRLRDHPTDELQHLKAETKLKGDHSAEALRGAFSAAAAAFADTLRTSADALETGSKKSPAREPRAAH